MDALARLREVYRTSRKWRMTTKVASADVATIRATGFDVIRDPTPNFGSHARLTHPNGSAAFTDENLLRLAAAFHQTAEE